MELTGGINGMEKGLELDALEQDRIREIFAKELRPYIVSSNYFEHGKSVFLYKKIRNEMEKYTNRIMDRVYEEMENKVMGSEFDMLDYVCMGLTSIPVDDIYSVDGVTECVKKYFE